MKSTVLATDVSVVPLMHSAEWDEETARLERRNRRANTCLVSTRVVTRIFDFGSSY
jgi:hypothetical protein